MKSDDPEKVPPSEKELKVNQGEVKIGLRTNFFRRRRRGSLLKRKPRMRGRRNISKRSTSEKR